MIQLASLRLMRGFVMDAWHLLAEVRRDALIIGLSRIVSGLIAVLGSMYLARTLGPEKIGTSGVVFNACAFVLTFANLINGTSLVLEFKSRTTAVGRQELICAATVLRGAICLCGSLPFLGFGLCSNYLGEARLIVLFLPLLVVLNATNPVWVFQAIEQQRVQAWLAVLNPLVLLLSALLVVRWHRGVGLDLALTSLALAVTISISWVVLHCRFINLCGAFVGPAFRDAKMLMGKSLWLFLAGAAGYVYLMFEEQLVGSLVSFNELGKYRGAKFLSDGFSVFVAITSFVLYPRYIEWRRINPVLYYRNIRQLAGLFSIVAAGIIVLDFALTPFLFPLLLGEEFRSASFACAMLITGKAVVLISNIYAWGLLADPLMHKRVSLIMILAAVLSVILNISFIPRFGILGAAITVLLCETLNLVLYYMEIRKAESCALASL